MTKMETNHGEKNMRTTDIAIEKGHTEVAKTILKLYHEVTTIVTATSMRKYSLCYWLYNGSSKVSFGIILSILNEKKLLIHNNDLTHL